MADEKRPVSTVRKIASVALVLLGSISLYVVLLGTTSAVLRPGKNSATFWILTLIGLAICLALISGGTALWQRWRITLGGTCLVLGAFTLRGVQYFRGWAAEKTGAEAAWLSHTASVFIVYAVLLALAGIALFLAEKSRQEPPQPPA